MPTTRSGMTSYAIDQLIAQRMAEAFTNHEEKQNNGNGSENGNGNHNETNWNTLMKRMINWGGTELEQATRWWFEKIESVFHISNCTTNCQVKFATYTLTDGALTWWKSHVKTAGIDAAYEIDHGKS
ncbi:hypothetical protein Tco_0906438 [Tanacetum coccineum]|uniref:Retrotransposon gag domain-containing protein n=1 Tax=Tanacetum coccineum TaxID=301880 RepID=A0ABQ5CIU5_9ASTR